MTERTTDPEPPRVPAIDLKAIYHRKTIAWRKEEDGSISIRWGGMYHVLNPTAAFLWETLDGQTPAEDVVERFVSRYQPQEPNVDLLRRCATESLGEMIAKGIITKPDSVWEESWDDED